MATTAGESIFVDTNVVVHARNADSPDHTAAKQRLSELQQSGAELWISRQVLREFGVVVSKQMMVRDAYDSAALVDEIERLEREYLVADEDSDVTRHWKHLIKACGQHHARVRKQSHALRRKRSMSGSSSLIHAFISSWENPAPRPPHEVSRQGRAATPASPRRADFQRRFRSWQACSRGQRIKARLEDATGRLVIEAARIDPLKHLRPQVGGPGSAMPLASSKFNDSLSRSERLENVRQRFVQGGEQRLSSAVADSEPEKLPCINRTRCQEKEVLIFAYHDPPLRDACAPELTVVRLALTTIKHMLRLVAALHQPSREGLRQLVVHEELHAATASTVWSVCRAA
jgi:predicted nucleic acid-binding protein